MRDLITGATGFTGGHLARMLASRGHQVRALVREATLARDPAKAADLTPHGIDIVPGDLADERSLDAAMHGVDVVYNLAAVYREAGVSTDTYRAVNATGVGRVIEAAGRAGVPRVVHCSTVGVHGDIEHPPANEDAPFKPGDVYQETKLEGESIARDAGQHTGVQVVIARPTGIFGPGDRRLLKLFRGVARRMPVLGSGQIYYHLTYIDDLVEGFRLCGETPAAAGRTYILAGAEATTLNELVRRIAAILGVKPPALKLPVWPFWLAGAACEAVCVPLGIEPPIYRRRVDFYTKSRAFDISRARRELGFNPQLSLDEGLRRTVAWYREHGWL